MTVEQKLRKVLECDLQKSGGRVFGGREENWPEGPETNPGLVCSRQGDNVEEAEWLKGKIGMGSE